MSIRECLKVCGKSLSQSCVNVIIFFVRLVYVKKANIPSGNRQTFERYGVVPMQLFLGTNTPFRSLTTADNNMTSVEMVRQPLVEWLTEQYQRAERRDNWHMIMEIAITVFVLLELLKALGYKV